MSLPVEKQRVEVPPFAMALSFKTVDSLLYVETRDSLPQKCAAKAFVNGGNQNFLWQSFSVS